MGCTHGWASPRWMVEMICATFPIQDPNYPPCWLDSWDKFPGVLPFWLCCGWMGSIISIPSFLRYFVCVRSCSLLCFLVTACCGCSCCFCWMLLSSFFWASIVVSNSMHMLSFYTCFRRDNHRLYRFFGLRGAVLSSMTRVRYLHRYTKTSWSLDY